MSAHDPNLPAQSAEQEPIGDPGLEPHQWRPTDVDPKAEKRAERQVAAFFGLSALSAIAFVVAYFTVEGGTENPTRFGYLGAQNILLGVFLGLALLFIGIGIIQWARKLMGDQEIVEMRHPAKSSEEDREATLAALAQGLEEAGIARRPLVRNSMLGAIGMLALPSVVLLRDLGKIDIPALARTIWAPGMRLVRDVVGTPIKASDLEVGDLVNGLPEALFPTPENGYPAEEAHGAQLQVNKAKTAIVIVRMEPDEIIPGPGREDWSIDGIICYSKICTHVGCPISLYERTTHHLLCPCHQSTFDLGDSARVVFGPAARPLPQLPLAVDDEGYLIAQSDFTEPVGPSYWERG